MKYPVIKNFGNKIILCVAGILLSSSVTSCASYRASSLSSLSSLLVTQESGQIKSLGLHGTARAFRRRDCKKYLDRDVISAGYLPVQL